MSYSDDSDFLAGKVLWKGHGKPLICSAIKMHNANRNGKHVAPGFVMPCIQKFLKSVH